MRSHGMNHSLARSTLTASDGSLLGTDSARAPTLPRRGRRAALFDMDRTLVRKDTASLYVKYQRDRGEVGLAFQLRLVWWLVQYRFGMLDAPRVAERVLREYAGRSEREFTEQCLGWYATYVREHICEAGRLAVARHLAAGDFVAIVTGSTEYAARPLARELGIEHVACTELEKDGDAFTGRAKALCYGHGKVVAAKALAEEHGFDLEDASFYTDSITDLPLLELVRERIVVNPDPRLRRLARRRGWSEERW